LSRQRHDGCQFFVMYTSAAKFKEHCSNILRDILDWVFHCFSGATYDVITHNTETRTSLKRQKILQKGKRHSSLIWKAFQISSNYFLLQWTVWKYFTFASSQFNDFVHFVLVKLGIKQTLHWAFNRSAEWTWHSPYGFVLFL